MSVLIKGMDMPKHCGYCRFRYDGICHALQKTQYAATDCPLVEVPTPHGRLIDANTLKVKFTKTDANGINLELDRYALKCIDNAPTIIEAEEGEDECVGS